MGQGWANPGDATGLHKAALGVVTPVVASDAGTYTLAPDEQPNPGQTQVLEVPRGDGSIFVLDYRRPYGTFDDYAPTDPVVNGVSVRLLRYDYAHLWVSDLLDMTPDGNFDDSSLRAGKTFGDPGSGIGITVNSVSATGASVTIARDGGGGPSTTSTSSTSTTSTTSASTTSTTSTTVAPPPGGPDTRVFVASHVLDVFATSGSDAITVTRSSATGIYTVTNSSNTLTVGNGCNALTIHVASCAGANGVLVRAKDGNDRITVNAGTNHATVNAGDGDDTINTENGHPDTVFCSGGDDAVVADPNDTVRGCEHVTS
jgi:hypothetical protein